MNNHGANGETHITSFTLSARSTSFTHSNCRKDVSDDGRTRIDETFRIRLVIRVGKSVEILSGQLGESIEQTGTSSS